MIICMVRFSKYMEKSPREFLNLFLCTLIALMLSLSFSCDAQTSSSTDSSGPLITDTTVGIPVTGQDFTVTAEVTDPSGVSYVRMSLYFNTSTGISPSQNILMDKIGSSYQHIFEVPNDALALFYTISANDTVTDIDNFGNWNTTSVITRGVKDDQSPKAMCNSTMTLNMGGTLMLNGSASTDNVGISNYTWTFFYNGKVRNIFGIAPSFLFSEAGQCPGNLTVTDHYGNRNSKAFLVNVLDTEAPMADAGIPMFVVSGNQGLFNGSWSSDNVGIVNYTWQFTYNESILFLYGVEPTFRFWTPGIYNATLSVRDAAGTNDTATVQVRVVPAEQDESSGVSWWIYVLIVMVFAIIVVGLLIIRT